MLSKWFHILKTIITDQTEMDCYDIEDSLDMVLAIDCGVHHVETGGKNHKTTLYVTITIIVALMMMILLYSLYQYRKNIAVLISNRSNTVHDVDESILDAYLVFNERENAVQNWVINVFIPRMEHPHRSHAPFKLFIPERDSLVGADKMEEIIRGIHLCRRTIVIVSPQFEEDQWLLYAFTAAHDFTIRSSEHSIIMVLFDRDHINMHSLSNRIQLYLHTFPPLVLGHPLFWRKLHHKMPPRQLRQGREQVEQTGILEEVDDDSDAEGVALRPVSERMTFQDGQTMHLALFREILHQQDN